MNTIKEFDANIKKLNSYNVLLTNVVKYIFSFFSLFGMLILFPEDNESTFATTIYISFMFCAAIDFHVKPYISILQQNKSVHIFPLLSDTPIQRKDFIYSRLPYLFSYLTKLLIGCAIVRTFTIFVLESPSLDNILASILYLFILSVVSVLSAVFDIYLSTR